MQGTWEMEIQPKFCSKVFKRRDEQKKNSANKVDLSLKGLKVVVSTVLAFYKYL
jgi:hypothetical protein